MTERSTNHSTIVIDRTYDASPSRVFAAWSDPEALLRWGSAGEGWESAIDRFEITQVLAHYGHVIDYILFHTPVWSFAVFNLADAFISVGAALVVFDEFIGWRRQAKPESPEA